jgi:hypothetical protein
MQGPVVRSSRRKSGGEHPTCTNCPGESRWAGSPSGDVGSPSRLPWFPSERELFEYSKFMATHEPDRYDKVVASARYSLYAAADGCGAWIFPGRPTGCPTAPGVATDAAAESGAVRYRRLRPAGGGPGPVRPQVPLPKEFGNDVGAGEVSVGLLCRLIRGDRPRRAYKRPAGRAMRLGAPVIHRDAGYRSPLVPENEAAIPFLSEFGTRQEQYLVRRHAGARAHPRLARPPSPLD